MGLIDEWEFRREIHGLQWPKLHGRPHVDLAKLLQVMADCRAEILSPAEIEAGIKWLKTNDKLNYPRYNAVDLINLLYAVLKKPERTWGQIFKVEEKKDET